MTRLRRFLAITAAILALLAPHPVGADDYRPPVGIVSGSTTVTGCSDKQVLFTDVSAVGCNASLRWDKTAEALKLGIGTGGYLDLGSAGTSIVATPPTAGTSKGWKLGLWHNAYWLGIATNTMYVKTGAWFSVSTNTAADNGSDTTPDSNAGVSLNGFDGSIWSKGFLTVVGGNIAGTPVGFLNAASSGAALSTPDLQIYRDAPDTWAQRRGTNAQTFRLYGRFYDAANYERFETRYDPVAAHYILDLQAAGTGVVRPLSLRSGGTEVARIPDSTKFSVKALASDPVASTLRLYGGSTGGTVFMDNTGVSTWATMTSTGLDLASGSAYKVGGTAGISATLTVRDNGGILDCSITISGGIVTASTC